MFSSWTSVLNSNSNFSNKVHNTNTNSNSDFADDWNHDIYLYNVNLNSNIQVKKMNTCNEMWNQKMNINLKKLDFPLEKDCRVFNKLEINGNKPNIDIVLATC